MPYFNPNKTTTGANARGNVNERFSLPFQVSATQRFSFSLLAFQPFQGDRLKPAWPLVHSLHCVPSSLLWGFLHP